MIYTYLTLHLFRYFCACSFSRHNCYLRGTFLNPFMAFESSRHAKPEECCNISINLQQLTCLVLPRDHCRLLETNSIWQSDQEVDKCSLVERILHLDPLEVPSLSFFLTSYAFYLIPIILVFYFFLSCLVAEYLQGYHST